MSQDPTSAALARQQPIRTEWLKATIEDIVDPQQQIVDPHHHLWDKPGSRYLFDELLEDLQSGHNIIATIFAPCHSMYRARGPVEMKPLGETEFVNGAAAQSDSGEYGAVSVCAGIIGEVDLSLGGRVEPVLEAHLRAAGPRLRGIRPTVGWHESAEVRVGDNRPHMLTEPKFQEAIRCIEARGLTLDLWVFFTQIDDVIALAQKFPNLTIILNHVGGLLGIGPHAGRNQETVRSWRQAMLNVARYQNVVLKLGGLGMRYAGFKFHELPKAPSSDMLVEKWKPYIETCIEIFGPRRCMFESNFPVDKGSYSYHVLWNAFKKLAAGHSKDERNRLFRDTAIQTYRLNLPASAQSPTAPA